MVRASISKQHYSWLRWPPFATYVLVFALFFIVAFVFLDPDFGWHITAGAYFLHHGFPATDIFTYTASNFPWVSHEWLNDIFVYVVYGAGGFPLLAAVFALLWMFAVWLVSRRQPTMLVIIATLALLPFAGIRALTWSVLFLAILLRLVAYRNGKYVVLLPLFFLLWANVHGSFVVGLAYLAYQAFKTRSLKLAVILAVSVAVTFINPYGYHLYTEILSTLMDSSLGSRIGEWQPFALTSISVPYVMLWVGVTAYGMRRTWRNWKEYLRIDILFFAASISHVRQLPLFIIVSLPFTARGIASIAALVPKQLDRSRRRFIAGVAIAFACITIVCGIITYADAKLEREAKYPVQAVAYLQQHPCSGQLFNSYNYGGYLIWKLPSEKVYIDGRMPSWSHRGEKYMDNYLRFSSDQDYRNDQIKKYGISCAIVIRTNEQLVTGLRDSGWHVAVDDMRSVLLIK